MAIVRYGSCYGTFNAWPPEASLNQKAKRCCCRVPSADVRYSVGITTGKRPCTLSWPSRTRLLKSLFIKGQISSTGNANMLDSELLVYYLIEAVNIIHRSEPTILLLRANSLKRSSIYEMLTGEQTIYCTKDLAIRAAMTNDFRLRAFSVQHQSRNENCQVLRTFNWKIVRQVKQVNKLPVAWDMMSLTVAFERIAAHPDVFYIVNSTHTKSSLIEQHKTTYLFCVISFICFRIGK